MEEYNQSNTISEIYEKNIKQIIKNGESFLPLYIKGFSDIHREYYNYVHHIFNMTKMNEMKVFGRIDQSILKMHEMYVDAIFRPHLSHADSSREIMKNYLEVHHAMMMSLNNPLGVISDQYQKQTES